MKYLYYSVLFLVAGAFCFTQAFPEPAVVQGSSEWTADVRFEEPMQISVKSSLDGKNHRYWYVILSLTNNYLFDVDFYPQSDLMTDTLEIIPAGKKVGKEVFEKIKKRHHKKYPFLELSEESDSRILQGSDNSRDIVLIWPDFDKQANAVKFYISGLSNETAVIDHPVEKGADGAAVKVFLRKTLELSYLIGGDASFREQARLELISKRWVMR